MPEELRNIDRFLKLLVKKNGSDLYIKSGSTPRIRINGQIEDLSREILSPQAVDEILGYIISDQDQSTFEREKEVEFIYEIRGLGRFRINVYQQMMGLAIAIRYIRIDIPSFEDLNLPPVLYSLITKPHGLLLVTGSTGSGKSTTLAAMIETLNRTSSLNIITIEDPIEFAFKEKRCTIQQREVGRDTPSWPKALKRIMRQAPDVIMLGEIRDSETILLALTAANTGHLVLSTLNTMDARQSINRIISLASPAMSDEIRHLLAATLVGTVSVRLLPCSEKSGRVPAVEVLVATETVRKMITDPEQVGHLRQIISEGYGQYGMQTFDQSLGNLHRSGLITLEEALKHASSPTDFRIRARGIDGQSGMSWAAPEEEEETE